jgi:hypothetical protein
LSKEQILESGIGKKPKELVKEDKGEESPIIDDKNDLKSTMRRQDKSTGSLTINATVKGLDCKQP